MQGEGVPEGSLVGNSSGFWDAFCNIWMTGIKAMSDTNENIEIVHPNEPSLDTLHRIEVLLDEEFDRGYASMDLIKQADKKRSAINKQICRVFKRGK